MLCFNNLRNWHTELTFVLSSVIAVSTANNNFGLDLLGNIMDGSVSVSKYCPMLVFMILCLHPGQCTAVPLQRLLGPADGRCWGQGRDQEPDVGWPPYPGHLGLLAEQFSLH